MLFGKSEVTANALWKVTANALWLGKSEVTANALSHNGNALVASSLFFCFP